MTESALDVPPAEVYSITALETARHAVEIL